VEYLTSFHAILETLKAGNSRCCLYITENSQRRGPRIREILDEALSQNISIQYVPESRLDEMSKDQRGAILALEEVFKKKPSLKALCDRVSEPRPSLILVLDHIEDPQNLGAILRSADAFGVDAVIMPQRRASPISNAAARASAGAIAWVPILRLSNLRSAVDTLKKAGYWVYAADMDGKPLTSAGIAPKSVIILGNEGSGVSQILRKVADDIVSIPMQGHVESLNVSVSAAILMYEFWRSNSGASSI
jgi:23S rRNA (guanosine2251-2'-O)-methyltransferase